VEVDEMTQECETNRNGGADSVTDQALPFQRMLVAIDASDAAQGAIDLAYEWTAEHGADVWFVQLTEERRQRRSECESDVDPMTVRTANHVAVRGPTLGARNRQLVQGIADAAAAFQADVIVLGFDGRRLAGHRWAPSLREQITRAVNLPVLVAPTRQPGGKAHFRLLPDTDGAEEQTRSRARRSPDTDGAEEQTRSRARRYAHV
jgi:nucleotide-binding universal stress UspA family protein